MGKNLVKELNQAIVSLNGALNDEIAKEVIATSYQDMVENTPGDIAARYWLSQFLAPLSRREIQSVIDGLLVQLLNEEQAKKLVKFLLVRFPNYYSQDPNVVQQSKVEAPSKPEAPDLAELVQKAKP